MPYAYYPRARRAVPYVTGLPVSLGLKLWFDASDSTTIIQSGGAVSQWNDKSGNGNHASQTTGAKQPTVATAAQNGLNTLNFVSASQQFFSLANSVAISVAGCDIFFVGRSDTSVVPGGSVTNSPNAFFEWFGGSSIWVGSSEIGGGVGAGTPANGTTYRQGSFIWDVPTNAATEVRMDGSSLALTNGTWNTGSPTATFDTIGRCSGTDYTDGYIAEILLFDRNAYALTGADVLLIESYLKVKWGTP